jgi:hypothetical protein
VGGGQVLVQGQRAGDKLGQVHHCPFHGLGEHRAVATLTCYIANTWSSCYQALARLPGLAVQARLYGLQMEELEAEGKKNLFTQMSRVPSATGNWDSLAHAQVTVCQVIVQYQDNMLDLNLAVVLIAGRFATVNLPHL